MSRFALVGDTSSESQENEGWRLWQPAPPAADRPKYSSASLPLAYIVPRTYNLSPIPKH
jgi:hypothetical protein